MVKVKTDLHNHIRTKGIGPDEDLFTHVCNITRKRLGKSGVLGVVNFQDERYEALTQQIGYQRVSFKGGIFVPEREIYIIKGQEVPTKDGHILVLGLEKDKHLKAGRPLEDTIKEVKNEHDAILIADHPFYKSGIGMEAFGANFDGVEVFNGEASLCVPKVTPKHANQRALENFRKFGSDYGPGALASSDGHSLYEIGRSYTLLESGEFTGFDNVIYDLRNRVRNARLEDTHASRFFGWVGGVDHLADLGLITLARKIGVDVEKVKPREN